MKAQCGLKKKVIGTGGWMTILMDVGEGKVVSVHDAVHKIDSLFCICL